MADRSKDNLDWYLISIDRLKKVGVILAILAVGGAGYYFWDQQSSNPKKRSDRAIADAERALNDLASSKDFSQFREDFDRARVKLDDAKSMFRTEKFKEAESAAIEAQTIAKTALAQLPGEQDSDAQFLTVEGDVQFQKGSNPDWRKADVRAPLFNGDWVRTGGGASAELIFSNGSLYTIGPDALLEIYSVFDPQTSRKQNSIQMQVGSVEINTTGDASTVQTPGTQVVISSESTAQVGVDKSQKSTQVLSLRGSSAVASKAGGDAISLSTGEQVLASKEGSLGNVSKFVPPPALLSPSDNQVFRATSDNRVQIAWTAQPAAAAYQLQVSRSRLFSSLEINAKRMKNEASAKVTSEGNFYWRVASIDASGKTGPSSPFRRFRVTGLGTTPAAAAEADKTPPTLTVKRPFKIGEQYFMIEGQAEPGATVFIDDEELSTETDGSFRKLVGFAKLGWNKIVVKAVDAAGNQTVKTESVLVEE